MTDNIALWRLAYVLPNLLAAFGMAFVATLVWRYRARRGGFALWVVTTTAAFWAFGEGAGFVGLPPDWILFFWKIGYIGVAIAPLALMIFALDYVGYAHLLSKRRIALLSILPVATFISVWTNEWHGWIWATVSMDQTTPIPTLSNTHGPLLWIYFAYCNLLVFITASFLLRRLAELQPPQRRQLYMILFALFVPLMANVLYMARLIPLRNMDLTPLAFNIAVIMFVRGLLLDRLFELVPVTSHEIYRSLEDAVFVTDDTFQVLDMNQAGRDLLPPSKFESIGYSLQKLLPEVVVLLRDSGKETRGEVWLGERCYDVRIALLQSNDERFSGRLLVWREITERKRLEAELQYLAITDTLTCLYNRRHFFLRGQEEIDRAIRYERPLSLIMLDLDHFKMVNDSYGHEAGDRVLIELAAAFTSTLRTVDCIGRIGGEEFALLLPETDAAAAGDVGQRLFKAVQETRIGMADGSLIAITISAGIVTMSAEETSINMLLRRADDALYQAKHEGRNRLVQL